ncbi:ssDNA endodeoxyribonuclease [Xylographa bjoerkii]|nr:ssDNA endodeoxyribonuclease [Xylographa bjoerkii]
MSLNDVWEAAAGNPFYPVISKERQFTVGFILLFTAFILTGLFGLSRLKIPLSGCVAGTNIMKDRSLKSIPLFAVPASLAFAYV